MNSVGHNIASSLEALKVFRSGVYESFPLRADAAMNLLDALTSHISANSVIELSLSPFFRRLYGSVHDAIHSQAQNKEELHSLQQIWQGIIGKTIPAPLKRNFYLLGVDTTGCPRPYANTLAERTINYHPNPAPGNNPIQVGHVYSLVAALPEKNDPTTPPWIIPLNMTRVTADKKAVQVAVGQMDDLLDDEDLPFNGNFTALTGDSAYSAPQFLHPMAERENVVVIVRVRGNRKFFRQAATQSTPEKASVNGKGHPTWFGSKFRLSDPQTWGEPDQLVSVPFKFKNGREAVASIMAWKDLVMSGKHDVPMHRHPFTLIRIVIHDAEGKPVFSHPLWLIAVGDRRHELTPAEIYNAYRQRYDLEHFFRYGKQKLLLTAYQTAEIQHEENWLAFVLLSYAQLYLMAPLAGACPYPWERYLPALKNREQRQLASPSEAKRDSARILKIVETPASEPKRRGTAPGRVQGVSLTKRERKPVIIKSKGCEIKGPP